MQYEQYHPVSGGGGGGVGARRWTVKKGEERVTREGSTEGIKDVE